MVVMTIVMVIIIIIMSIIRITLVSGAAHDAACGTTHDAVGHLLQPASLCPDSTKVLHLTVYHVQKESM
jgi:hypothetical protein